MVEQPRKLSGLAAGEGPNKQIGNKRVGSSMVEQPRKLSGLAAGEGPNKQIGNKWVGSSMVEQRPFKALAAGSSPAQPKL